MKKMIASVESLEIAAAWKGAFRSNDPFSWPFGEDMEMGRIFYPTDSFHLTRPQYSALLASIHGIGEAGFYMSVVESEGLVFLERSWGHWTCDMPSYEEYSAIDLCLESALYSRNGNWGILISHEMHAIIGGSKSFIGALDKKYLDWAEDLLQFEDYWFGNPNRDWVDSILSRVTP